MFTFCLISSELFKTESEYQFVWFSIILIFCSLFPSELSSSTLVLAGHTLREWDFREKYLNKLFQTPQVISVFLQDRVSKARFKRRATVVANSIDQMHVPQHGSLKVALEMAFPGVLKLYFPLNKCAQ